MNHRAEPLVSHVGTAIPGSRGTTKIPHTHSNHSRDPTSAGHTAHAERPDRWEQAGPYGWEPQHISPEDLRFDGLARELASRPVSAGLRDAITHSHIPLSWAM